MRNQHYEITTRYFGDRSVAKLTAKGVQLAKVIPGRLNQDAGNFEAKVAGEDRAVTFDQVAGTLGWTGFEHLALA